MFSCELLSESHLTHKGNDIMAKSSTVAKTTVSPKTTAKALAAMKKAAATKPAAAKAKAPAAAKVKAPAAAKAKAPAAAKVKAPARHNKADITRKMLTDALAKVDGDASKLPRQDILKRLQTNKSTQMTVGQSVRYYHMCLHNVLGDNE
jgi:hypothetical protein